MKVLYLAGPYRAPTLRGIINNIRKAEKVAIALWQAGFAVICPHLNTQLFDGICDDNIFIKGYLEIVKRCDMVVLLPGWEKSEGARKEIALAKQLEIPILKLEDIPGFKTFLEGKDGAGKASGRDKISG